MAGYAGAYVYRDASVTIDGTEYAAQITKALLVPETPVQTTRTLVPDGTIVDVDSAVWTFELSAVQSIAVTGTGGLSDKLNNSEPGELLDVVLTPKVGTGLKKATFTVLAMPVAFGGEQGNLLTFDVVLPVSGGVTFGTAA
jgi:hypothetical protein